MKTSNYLKLFFLLILLGCTNAVDKPIEANIIPKPLTQKINDGIFILDKNVSLKSENELSNVTNYFKSYLKERFQFNFSTNKTEKNILFKIDDTIANEEGYQLKISENEIFISAKTVKGAFYAVQSLVQLLPIKTNSKSIAIQCLEIKDEPQFVYRGMHLDVARHFFSVDFIKKYIDLMALLKMNTFHWHLTEDQGWRIEIKKYPKLQEIAAFRTETLMGHYSDQPHQFDGKKYGGFYSQKQIKEIVRYASERQITIIPEIEMPGHSQASIAAYPELGCTGEQIEVATKWGVFEDIYCPKETTFQFLENVIDEVVALFPGKYIHIGGDEAPKTNWKNCAHCQELIKKEGLKDEHELQSYFITRMEKYINQKGKQLIGWDEILEGGLAPNATVMSWRGTHGAFEAAKQKHNVILTPGSHCYFDHYQSDNENEPLAIGGFLPLEKVYSFNPIPDELTKEESTYVLGAQGNIWTEYMSTPEKVEYMAFPRAIALAEVVWSSKENRNYTDFISRLEHFNERLDAMNVNYANHIYDVKGELKNENGNLKYELKTTTNNFDIFYSTDGGTHTELYEKPFIIDKTMTIKAQVYDSGIIEKGNPFEQKINLHKAVGQKISLNVEPHKAYNAGGKQALINGISGNNKRYGDAEWLGFSGDDLEITIDLGKKIKINKVNMRFYDSNGQWIYEPDEVYVYAYNEIEYNPGDIIIRPDFFYMASLLLRPRDNSTSIRNYEYEHTKDNYIFDSGSDEKIRYIKIWVKNYGIIPDGKQGAGNKAWTFIDEIIVE